MELKEIIEGIDGQIAKLMEARRLLAGVEAAPVKRPGRPKGSKNTTPAAKTTAKTTGRKLSPEGRKRIADAMKRRWAARKKAVGK